MSTRPFSVIFAGTSAFAVPSLDALVSDERFLVDLVITQPDRPTGRKQLLTLPPVKEAALRHGLQVKQPESFNKEPDVLPPAFDFLVVVSYGQILSQAILDRPAIAPVNVHASLLPRWRGASPIQHTILAGDTETGVSIQIMHKELDAGPIIAQIKTPVAPRETTPTLHDRLATMGADLLLETLINPLKAVPQDPSGITICGKLSREDGKVDVKTMTAEEIDRRVRALTPWPGVSMEIDGQTLKILETSLELNGDAVEVPCKDRSTLYLSLVQPSGKKPMRASDWKRGKR